MSTDHHHTDAAGSVVAITGPSGSVVASYRYDAFGAVVSTTGSDPIATRNPLRYRAYYHDAATGLYYLPARYYDPATARFLSPDPAPPSAGDPLSLNRYTYCAGDPVNFYDSDGARHEAGSGVGAPVATEAIEYAKRGDMDAATAVQTAYRDGLSTSREGGSNYDEAHRRAQEAARTAAIAERAVQDGVIDWIDVLEIGGEAENLRRYAGAGQHVLGAVSSWASGASAAFLVVGMPQVAGGLQAVALGSRIGIAGLGAGMMVHDTRRAARGYCTYWKVAIDAASTASALAVSGSPSQASLAVAMYTVPTLVLADNFVK